jgi:hypothetical protein
MASRPDDPTIGPSVAGAVGMGEVYRADDLTLDQPATPVR